jgi:type VI secretion system protein ImpL
MKTIIKIAVFVLILLALLAVCLIIWYVGPLVAIGSARPFESTTVRWILIALVIGLWVGRQLWVVWKAKRTNAQFMEGLLKRPPKTAAPQSASDEEIARLGKRFEEAIEVLKQVRLSSAGKRLKVRDLFSLSGRQYLYQLPWYIFIGPPGSGKTTALVHSGLQFPLAEKFGTHEISGVGGTRNCDWWFTDEAVLIDTAGRFATQESNREVDSAGWLGFLELLKKSRPRQPINGVILTVSTADLLQQTGHERDAQAQNVRARLQELQDKLQISLPIYVLVTKADLLAGFSEFFLPLGKEERGQVWGVTFPYDPEARVNALPDFVVEFAALERRLLDRVMDRMQTERAMEERAAVFAFPQQFENLRAPLEDYLTRVFSSSKYEQPPLLRGVFFTSGTQEGSPIDRVMGSLARAFSIERKLVPAQAGAGKSFFITRLLRDVIFAEAGVAGTNLKLERRRTYLRWAAYGLAGLFLVCASVLWVLSYSNNKAYDAEVNARVPAAQQLIDRTAAAPGTNVMDVLPVLNTVRDIAQNTSVAGGGEPWTMGFGLWQGRKLDAAAQGAYRTALRDLLLPRLSLRVEEQLRGANASNLEFAYEALKAYLMLNDSSHYDPVDLKAWITFDWDRTLPRDVTQEQRQELVAHLDALLERGAAASARPADANLIGSVRNMLARYPLAARVYSRLRREGVAQQVADFSLVKEAGPGAAAVFTRASGEPLTKGVSGLFTYNGYYQAFRSASEKVANQLADEEGWVLGDQSGAFRSRLLDPEGRQRLTEEVRRLYLEDYANTWDAYLKDIKLIRPSSLQQCIEIARLLSAPDNPLVPFLRAASHETTLIKADSQKSISEKANDTLNDTLKNTQDTLSKLFTTDAKAATPGQRDKIENIVDSRFDSLRRYVASTAPGQPAPIEATIGLIGELQAMLNAADSAIKAKAAPPPSDVPNKVKTQAPGMPDPLGPILSSLSSESAKFAAGATKVNLTEQISASVGDFCRQAVPGRYPFVRASTRDVTQDDFATLFAPGGKFDDAFQHNLADKVDTSAHPWAFKLFNDAEMGSASFLAQFQHAASIRDVFFRAGGRTPGLKLDFKPLEMDAAILQFTLDVDGQLVRYSHGPQVPQTVLWPGPRGSTLVRIQIDPPGPSGLSGVTTEGSWALFRMLDKARIDPTSQPERFDATFTVDGRSAKFEILASSVVNPFRMRDIEAFQCP